MEQVKGSMIRKVVLAIIIWYAFVCLLSAVNLAVHSVKHIWKQETKLDYQVPTRSYMEGVDRRHPC